MKPYNESSKDIDNFLQLIEKIVQYYQIYKLETEPETKDKVKMIVFSLIINLYKMEIH